MIRVYFHTNRQHLIIVPNQDFKPPILWASLIPNINHFIDWLLFNQSAPAYVAFGRRVHCLFDVSVYTNMSFVFSSGQIRKLLNEKANFLTK